MPRRNSLLALAIPLIQPGSWYHVVGEYTTEKQPESCVGTATYPGSIAI
jgi:hypothetical protein